MNEVRIIVDFSLIDQEVRMKKGNMFLLLDCGFFVCQAERKLVKAERALHKVEAFLKPTQRQADPESITDEERFMFRKLGLRMKAYLLLGKTIAELTNL